MGVDPLAGRPEALARQTKLMCDLAGGGAADDVARSDYLISP